MRSRILFTVLTLGIAAVMGLAAGATLHDYGHAFVVTLVVVMGVLTIGILEWDHSKPAKPARTIPTMPRGRGAQ
jgi:hypothetical protein